LCKTDKFPRGALTNANTGIVKRANIRYNERDIVPPAAAMLNLNSTGVRMGEYQSKLGVLETEEAIKFVKDTFERALSNALNLRRVSAPLFVLKSQGLNDNLNGVERPWRLISLKQGRLSRLSKVWPNGNGTRSRNTGLKPARGCIPT
jgi:hypothetical protein